jgi:UDP-N-acetylglucosamine--dolichyl-phosphate N-acetylglucosaminephosphotransferase
MELLLIIPILISLILAVIAMPKWIRKCRQLGLMWEDMNKFKHPRNVASSGGIIVVMAFILGVLSYIAIRTFIIKDTDSIIINALSLLSIILIVSLIGLVDDFLGWKKGGLSWRFRVLLAFVASIPLIAINAGHHTMDIPFIGAVNFGLIYPLILIPIGVAGATTTYNFLAGFNGLEAGQGIIIISFLSLISFITGTAWLSVIGLIMVASLLVFYYYNKFPAKVFPGNILTWSIGSLIACMAILGNFEKIAVFIFILYIIETVLKAGRGKLKKQSFGIPDKNNNLTMPYDKIYGITHLGIFILSKFKKDVKEKDVVYFIICFQIILCLVSLFIFRESLFV